MSIPRLDKLRQKCLDETGEVPEPAGKKLSKEDYIAHLREHFMPTGGLPYKQITPMLCFDSTQLKDQELENAWESGAWIVQEKMNGIRAIVHIVKDVGIFITSRTVSVKTWRYEELSRHFVFHNHIPNFSAVLDAEIMISKPIDSEGFTTKGTKTKSSLHSTTSVLHLLPSKSRALQRQQNAYLELNVFDCLSHRGVDYKNTALEFRLTRLAIVMESINNDDELASYFNSPEYTNKDKREFFDSSIASGKEGVVLKRLGAKYEDSSSRSRKGWVKVKKSVEIDAFVTGYGLGAEGTAWEGMIATLQFSVRIEGKNKNHVIGLAGNMTLEERVALTVKTDHGPILKGEYYGRVAALTGQDISARQLRLSHCRINRWRDGVDGKTAEECVSNLSDLQQASSWVD